MDSLYRDNILDHYNNPRNFGRLDNPDASHEENNPFCGDKIGIDIKVIAKDQRLKTKAIKQISFYGEGCAISMASASMLTERIKKLSIEESKKLNKEDVLEMLGIELTPTRLTCALLPLEVLQKTLRLAKMK